MARPPVSAVKKWTTKFSSPKVTVESGTAVFDQDYWRVTPEGKRPKYFYGERAWSDAQRFAGDLDMGAWGL